MSVIGPLAQDVLNKCIEELKKENHREKISKHIVDPVFKEIIQKFYAYYLIIVFVQIIIVFLLSYIIIKLNRH